MHSAMVFGGTRFSCESISVNTINKIIARRFQPRSHVNCHLSLFSIIDASNHFNKSQFSPRNVRGWNLHQLFEQFMWTNILTVRRDCCVCLRRTRTGRCFFYRWWEMMKRRTTWKIYGFPSREIQFFPVIRRRKTMKMSPSCLRSLLLHAIFAFFDANIKFIMMIRDWNLAHNSPPSKKIPFVNISHHWRVL